MIRQILLPQELFETIGSTIGRALADDKKVKRLRISKISMEMQVELAPDLNAIEMPSNQQKFMDQKQPINLFKIKVKAH